MEKINSNSNKFLLIYVWVISFSSLELVKLFWVSLVLIIKVIVIMWMIVVFMKVKCMKESCEIFDGFKIFVGSVYIIFFKVN